MPVLIKRLLHKWPVDCFHVLHFDRNRLPDARLYWRRRGDTTFLEFSAEDYESVRRDFKRAEKLELLDR